MYNFWDLFSWKVEFKSVNLSICSWGYDIGKCLNISICEWVREEWPFYMIVEFGFCSTTLRADRSSLSETSDYCHSCRSDVQQMTCLIQTYFRCNVNFVAPLLKPKWKLDENECLCVFISISYGINWLSVISTNLFAPLIIFFKQRV